MIVLLKNKNKMAPSRRKKSGTKNKTAMVKTQPKEEQPGRVKVSDVLEKSLTKNQQREHGSFSCFRLSLDLS